MLTALALAGAATVATTAPAQAGDRPEPGNRSLAAVLAADGGGFDHTAGDFDILDNAVRAVLAEKPKSPVRVLTQGRTRLTAFAPTDGAFRRLVTDLTGKRHDRERRVFTKLVKAAGVDTVEDVLLYHVVPGATITYKQARAAGGERLETALEDASLRVRVRHARVILVDADRNDPNARVIKKLRNLNKGNKQIAHGISQVLRPADL
jgi:uncharacterized surface protein with fasciclin (FAS1) repeats